MILRFDLPASARPTPISRRAAAVLVLAGIIFFALNICVSLMPSLTLDFTQGHIYTLSPVTRAALKDMKEKVTLRLYLSRALAQSSSSYAAYAMHVRELLMMYAARSHGKIALEVIDPESYSDEEDRAAGFGLRGIPIEGRQAQAYFGLVGTNSVDNTETIPFLAPEREPFLEYDLTRMIAALEAPQQKIIGVIDGAGAFNSAHPWAALEQARQQFTLREVFPTATAIDPDVSVLLVIHPKNLDPKLLFAIDQFVLGGGHALVFVDPDAESVTTAVPSMIAGRAVPGGGASDLGPLLSAWGIAYDPSKVVGDWNQGMRIEAESAGRPIITEFPPYIADQPPYLNTTDPVTGNLKSVNLVTAGALAPLPDAATSFTPLLQSSPRAALLDAADVAGDGAASDPMGVLAKYKPGDNTYTMAARLVAPTGGVKTAFPDGPPKDMPKGATAAEPILKQAQKPTEVIVVADTDLLADRSWTQLRDMGSTRVVIPFAGNGDFLINALENLSGGAQLASLRARGLGVRPLTRIEDMQRAADDRYRATEETLSQNLDETRRRLLTLSPAGSTGKTLLSGEQQDAVRRFRAEMAEERRQLRDVQRDLNRGIDRLETALKLANILLVPFAVTAFTLLVGLRPAARRRLRKGAL